MVDAPQHRQSVRVPERPYELGFDEPAVIQRREQMPGRSPALAVVCNSLPDGPLQRTKYKGHA